MSAAVLLQLARSALTLESVEIETRLGLTIHEMRAILDFPHRYAPVTADRGLITVVDQSRVALKLGRFAIRAR